MKLLILTQKVSIDDDVLGFMHRWITEFAQHVQIVTVICLHAERYELSTNVRVISMGKEQIANSKWQMAVRKFIYVFRFFYYIWRERHHYDTVFVHMNHEYVVMAGLLWRIMGKRVALWYAHGYVPWTLYIAKLFVHDIFTSTTSGFRLSTKKLHVVGQGIDTDQFQPTTRPLQQGVFTIISVGRISPVKDYATLIRAAAMLRDQGKQFQIMVIGQLGLVGQGQYLDQLRLQIGDFHLESVVHFIGAVPNREIPGRLVTADLFVNMSRTGSLDKAMLEAMACGLPLATCNESMHEVLGSYVGQLMYPGGDARALTDKIAMVMDMSIAVRKQLGVALRAIVVRDHDLRGFIKKIVQILSTRS